MQPILPRDQHGEETMQRLLSVIDPFLQIGDMICQRVSCLIYFPETIKNHIRCYLLGKFDGFGRKEIIAVQKAEIIPRRIFHAGIPGHAEAFVLLVDHRDAAVPSRPFVADSGTGIRGTVVNEQDLQVLIGLAHHAADADVQVGLRVIHRDHNRNQIFHTLSQVERASNSALVTRPSR